MSEEPNSQLRYGVRYRVTMEDCCIEGGFTAAFQQYRSSSDGTVEQYKAVFDNGVEIGPMWGAWKAEEL